MNGTPGLPTRFGHCDSWRPYFRGLGSLGPGGPSREVGVGVEGPRGPAWGL